MQLLSSHRSRTWYASHVCHVEAMVSHFGRQRGLVSISISETLETILRFQFCGEERSFRAVHSAILSEAAHEQNLPFNPEKKGLWAETGKKELLIKKGRLESNFPAFRAWSSTTRAFKNVTAPFSSTRPMGTAQKVVSTLTS